MSDLRRMSGSLWRAMTFLAVCVAAFVSASCKSESCEPKTYYGPPPCQSDQQCIDAHGAGWYCDANNVIDEACGVEWPACKQR